MIDIQNLRVVRGKRVALDNISVQIARGTITGVLGPSGCGKTTLMRCIVGTQLIDEGTVTVLGRPAGSAELRHRVGYVTQDPTIYNDLRIVDNVRYFEALYGIDSEAADQAIAACLPSEVVLPRSPADGVVPLLAEDLIRARVAECLVPPDAAADDVISRAAVDDVIAASAVDDVVARPGIDDVGPGASVEVVVALPEVVDASARPTL